MNRNRLIAGIILVALMVLAAAGVWLWRSTNHLPPAGHKILITKLGYCGLEDTRPCIVSFSQIGDGNMLVNILVPSSTYPKFYLMISRVGEEYKYECKKTKGFPTSISCIGREMFPGELLQFTLYADGDEHVLAEGQFAIIGLMLSTPVAEALELTPSPESPTESPPSIFLEILTPTPSATSESYPNPSYDNP